MKSRFSSDALALALFALPALCGGCLLPVAAAERVALVIGIDAYDLLPNEAQLSVAVSDATLMAETLASIDPPFEVDLVTDVGWREAQVRFDRFLSRASGAECALVYFAGHGVEYHGENFLLVRDSDISDISADVERMKRRLGAAGLSLQSWVDSLDGTGASVKVVILDCCRDNPLQVRDASGRRSLVGSSHGLAQVTPPSGTLISYSADAGQQANDGLFTEILAKQISTPGRSILQVFAATREEVGEISGQWAAEDAARGLPVASRRVRHEPAEYNKLNLSGLEFRFSRGAAWEAVEISDGTAEMAEDEIQRRALVLAEKLAEKRLATVGGDADEMAKVRAELEEARRALAESGGIGMARRGGEELGSDATMSRALADGESAFHSARGMEGSRAGEAREFGGIEMHWCPPGEFRMGSPESEPGRDPDERQRQVTLTRGFWIARTETTQAQWERAMGTCAAQQRDKGNAHGEITAVGPGVAAYFVSWDDAWEWVATMNRLHPLPEGWRWTLPTEAQWEYACRAGSETAVYSGPIEILGQNHAPALDAIAWYGGNSSVGYEGPGRDTSAWNEKQYPGGVAGTREVGGKVPNAWGLHDMIGNLWEWCADWYGEYQGDEVADPTGPPSGTLRVARGGSWDGIARFGRSATRSKSAPGMRYGYLGFRAVVVPPGS